MKIYTRRGDEGETGMPGGRRVRKDDPRTEACGTVDELSALLGLARSEPLPPRVDEMLGGIQCQLFCLGARLASAKPMASESTAITPDHIRDLEAAIDAAEGQLPPLASFILPGGTRGAALLHVARTVCRRAERRVVSLAAHEPAVGTRSIAYLNRLGDLLFVLARLLNSQSGKADIPWSPPPDR